MKKFSLFIFLLGGIALAATSCKKCGETKCVHGTCVDGSCECEPGWVGDDCSDRPPCYQVVCENGQCVEGACVCDPGFEGPDCLTPVNAKFLGSYWLDESCMVGGSPANYNIAITDSGATNLYMGISGLWQSPALATAYVSGADLRSFTVDRQPFGTDWEIEGSGSLQGNGDISIQYDIFDDASNALVDRCSGILSK